MSKTVFFSIVSLALMALVLCWILRVLPGHHGRSGTTVALVGKKGTSAAAATSPGSAGPVVSEDGLSVYFSPDGGCTDAIVHAIADAKTSVYVQAAQFTSVPIARAVVQA